MPFRVTCTTCGTRFALSDDLYERKIKNRIVTIRCRSCSSDISVDGSALEPGAAGDAAGAAADRVLDSDAVPALAKPGDLTPTVPMPTGVEGQTPTRRIETRAKGEGLWVVCCPDQDDRELTLPEIESAIAKNEINGDAIVWRDGMAEWLPIHQVPELRVLLKKPPLPKPKGRTLLGIGVKPVVPPSPPAKPVAPVAASDPDNEPVSVEPEPLSETSEQLMMQRRGSAVALSPGLLSVKGGKPEPPPRKRMDSIPEAPPRPKLDSKPEPPPRKRMDSIPEAPPRPKLDSIPEPPPRPKLDSVSDAPARPRMDSRPDRLPKPPTPVRPVPKLLLEERSGDSAPDSSGTPNLRALASVAPKPKKPHDEGDKRAADEFLWQINPDAATGNELLGAPTIDVANLTAPPAPERQPEPKAGPSEAPPSSKKKKKKRAGAGVSTPPKASVAPVETAPVEPAPESRAEPQQKKGGALWAVLVVVAVVGGGFWLIRGRGTPATPPEPPAPTTVAAQPSPPAPPPAAEPTPPSPPVEQPVAAAPEATAEKPAAPAAREETPARNEPKPPAERDPQPPSAEAKPVPKEAPAATATAKPEKPAPVATTSAPAQPPAEGAPAAAFDRAAANAALNSAAAQASACRKEGDPTGAAPVVVTFAPSGRVTSANVTGPPFAGTATGGCIAAAMRRARVPAFTGDHVTVGKTVAIR